MADEIPIPELPPYLTNTPTVIWTINIFWVITAVISYALHNHDWVKISISGIILGIIGNGTYLIQRKAYKKGLPGAQKVLN